MMDNKVYGLSQTQLFDDVVFYEFMCDLFEGILSSLDCRPLHRKATSKV